LKKDHTKKFTLVLRSSLSQMAKVEPFLLKINKVLHLDEVEFNKLFLATSEAVTNGIVHGNKLNPKKKVIVTCLVNLRTITMCVHDEGMGFNAHHLPNPVAKENLLNENGRGIFLIRTVMDSVKWRKVDGTEIIMKLKRKSSS
jgi:serine/threonine-protein kinase RsbW